MDLIASGAFGSSLFKIYAKVTADLQYFPNINNHETIAEFIS